MALLWRQSNLETNFSAASSCVLTRNRPFISLKVRFLMPHLHSSLGGSPVRGLWVVLLYKTFFFIEPLSGTGGNHTIDLHPTKEEEKMCPTQIFPPNLHRHELQTALCFFSFIHHFWKHKACCSAGQRAMRRHHSIIINILLCPQVCMAVRIPL